MVGLGVILRRLAFGLKGTDHVDIGDVFPRQRFGKGTVEGGEYAGGVAGYASGTVSDCRALLTAEGQILQTSTYDSSKTYCAGGVVGYGNGM